jgi:hypothetical protein
MGRQQRQKSLEREFRSALQDALRNDAPTAWNFALNVLANLLGSAIGGVIGTVLGVFISKYYFG